MTFDVFGTVETGFEAVRDVFAEGFDGKPAMGAGLCIRVDGRIVVDLWGGIADTRTGRAWEGDTPSVIFSCTKGIVGILAAQLVAEGVLDYDAPVTHYWPEFGAAGKDKVTVGEALSHRAGLSATRADLSPEDVLNWDRMTAILAEQEPLWEPGTGHAYHALTHGWINGEIIRRASGKSVGANLRDRIAKPLAADVCLGQPGTLRLPPAHIRADAELSAFWNGESVKPEPNWLYRAMTLGHAMPADLVTPDEGFNDPRVQAAEIPGAGGIASARALSAVWSATVVETDGVRLLDEASVARATVPQSFGPQIFDAPEPYCSWGMSLQLDSPARRYHSAQAFGHDGAGGQVGFADPVARVGFGFVTNWMVGAEDKRATRVIDTLRDIIG